MAENIPEYGVSITRTARGDYEAVVYEVDTVTRRHEHLPAACYFKEIDRYTCKQLPDFMWQLAKRIMPK